MGGIANQHHPVVETPGRGLGGEQRARRSTGPLADQTRQHRQQVGKVFLEQRTDVVGRFGGLEAVGAFVRQEQRERVRTIAIGMRHEQPVRARPDVQRGLVDHRRAVGARGQRQFLVAPLQIFLVVIRAHAALHLGPAARERAIGADHPVGGDPARGAAGLDLQLAAVLVHAQQAVIEMQGHARLALGAIQQQADQFAAVDRIQHFAAVLAVGLEAGAAIGRVDHASAHHHGERHDHVDQPDFGQRLDAALGQAEVDRPAALGAVDARILAAFVHIHAVAALGQRQRQQRTGQPAADDRDPSRSARVDPGCGTVHRHRAASGALPARNSISAWTSASTACSK